MESFLLVSFKRSRASRTRKLGLRYLKKLRIEETVEDSLASMNPSSIQTNTRSYLSIGGNISTGLMVYDLETRQVMARYKNTCNCKVCVTLRGLESSHAGPTQTSTRCVSFGRHSSHCDNDTTDSSFQSRRSLQKDSSLSDDSRRTHIHDWWSSTFLPEMLARENKHIGACPPDR